MAISNLEERKLTLTEAKQQGLVSDYAPYRFENVGKNQKEFRRAYEYTVDGRNIGVVNNEGLLRAMGASETASLPESFYINAFKTYIDKIFSGAQYSYNDKGFAKAREVQSSFFDNLSKMVRTEGQREIAKVEATSKRAMRATGGLLSSVSGASLGQGGGTAGPMLGDQPSLGESSSLGMRRIL